MEKEEEDDDCGDGAIHRPSLVPSDVKEPEEKRETNSNQRKEQVNQEVDVDALHSLSG